MTADPTPIIVDAVDQLAATPEGRLDLARMLTLRDREVSLWRSVFGPESREQLAHLAACMYCVPICGHEEDRCRDYDGLSTSVAARMGTEAAARVLDQLDQDV